MFNRHPSSTPNGNFIPFNNIRQNYNNYSPGSGRAGNNNFNWRGHNNRRGGRNRHNQSQRFGSPYEINGNRGFNHSSNRTPQSHYHNRNNRGNSFGGARPKDFSQNNSMGGKTPLKEIPIDKFIMPSMIADPWADFNDTFDSGRESSGSVLTLSTTLEPEDLTSSDHPENVANSEDGSSPIHDTGSESPNIATTSTSEKDTESDA